MQEEVGLPYMTRARATKFQQEENFGRRSVHYCACAVEVILNYADSANKGAWLGSLHTHTMKKMVEALKGKRSFSQYADSVVNFSSQYGTDGSEAYVAANLAGDRKVLDKYGDFTEAFVLV